MSEFVRGLKDKETNDVQYKGNAFLRLMGYLKPYIKTVLICFVLPASLSFVFCQILRKWGWIKENDLKLEL